MNRMNLLLLNAFSVLTSTPNGIKRVSGRRASALRRSDQGDIPGWVMIAIMSAAVVVVLIPFVGPVIAKAFSSAVDGVSNTKSGSTGQ